MFEQAVGKHWTIIQIPFPHSLWLVHQSSQPFEAHVYPKAAWPAHCFCIKIKHGTYRADVSCVKLFFMCHCPFFLFRRRHPYKQGVGLKTVYLGYHPGVVAVRKLRFKGRGIIANADVWVFYRQFCLDFFQRLFRSTQIKAAPVFFVHLVQQVIMEAGAGYFFDLFPCLQPYRGHDSDAIWQQHVRR